MSQEDRELIELIRSLLAPGGRGRDDGPPWLAGAEVEVDAEGGPPPRLKISCHDGSRFTVMALQLEISRERREQLERERAERQARPRTSEELRQVEASIRDLAERVAERHEAHEGELAACDDEICKLMSESVARMGGEIYLPDDGPAH